MPDINIPATTAMETLNPNGRLIALQSGANVVMPNATEGDYRRKYEIYPGKICINDSPAKCRNCIERKINSIGRTVSTSKGFRRPLTPPTFRGDVADKKIEDVIENILPLPTGEDKGGNYENL